MRKIFFVVIFAVFLCGCAEETPTKPGVVDYMTGAEQIKTYKKTKSKIEDINKTLKDRYEYK